MEPEIPPKKAMDSKACPIVMTDPDWFNSPVPFYDRNQREKLVDPKFSVMLCVFLDSDRRCSLKWCTCGHCANDIVVRQNICCAEIAAHAEHILKGKEEINSEISMFSQFHSRFAQCAGCIAFHSSFEQLFLNSEVLELAADADALRCDKKEQLIKKLKSEDPNRIYRYYAYRNFILWSMGKLGYRNRYEIPACVRKRIIDKFPSPSGQYTGFMIPSLDC